MSKILIVGAGIAGLALYRALQQHQLDADLIEKHTEWADEGNGLCLPANAVAGLESLGLKAPLLKIAHQVHSIEYAKADGTTLAKASLDIPPLNQQPFLALHRSQLLELLREGLESKVRFGLTLKAIQQDGDGVEVQLSDGSTARYDLVVGADGIYSQTRQLAFAQPGLEELGVSNWRFVVPMNTTGLQPVYYLGHDEAFMIYPIGRDSAYCYAQVADKPGRYMSQAPRQVLPELFGHYAPQVTSVIQELNGQVPIFAGRLRAVQSREVYRGRVVLVGDALHACPPALQQEVGQAMEDVLSLSELLAHHELDEALAAYKTKRLPRIRWVINESNRMIRMATKGRFWLGRVLRDRIIRRSGPVNVAGWKHLLSKQAF